jgi:hypothetical protein
MKFYIGVEMYKGDINLNFDKYVVQYLKTKGIDVHEDYTGDDYDIDSYDDKDGFADYVEMRIEYFERYEITDFNSLSEHIQHKLLLTMQSRIKEFMGFPKITESTSKEDFEKLIKKNGCIRTLVTNVYFEDMSIVFDVDMSHELLKDDLFHYEDKIGPELNNEHCDGFFSVDHVVEIENEIENENDVYSIQYGL